MKRALEVSPGKTPEKSDCKKDRKNSPFKRFLTAADEFALALGSILVPIPENMAGKPLDKSMVDAIQAALLPQIEQMMVKLENKLYGTLESIGGRLGALESRMEAFEKNQAEKRPGNHASNAKWKS